MLYKGFKQDMIAMAGELVGTCMFIFLGLGCIKTAQDSQSAAQAQTATSLGNQTIIFISAGMGLSLLITAWVFYRITGGLFNPAVTLSLYLIGGLKPIRALLLGLAQIIGGIAGSALIAALTPNGGINGAITSLEKGMNIAQGLFLEMFLTAMLVFTVLMLAAEKHKATYLAPIGIGLTLFVCQMFGTLWTGCGMNPARSFGPSVVTASFPKYHWIYWVGPFLGSLLATGIYSILKAFDYGSVVLGQDSDSESKAPAPPVEAPVQRLWHASMGYTRDQRKAMIASGMRPDELERAEAGMVAGSHDGNHPSLQGMDGQNEKTRPPPGGRYGANGGDSQSRHSDTTLDHGRSAAAPAQGDSGPDSPTAPARGGGQQTHVAPIGYTKDGEPIPSIMNAQLQDRGGIGAPGAHEGGFSNFKWLHNAVRG
ncbi:MAG: hypothetical protein CYPHOPRED_000082 [Cyphobasidiales sp. Tagirdzhanova-0007]|nr:MAG: hypothetical protein CYPHOPRED_000082 [Cyphobasidiales sp. Tagirdzhanova-0007]